MTDMTCIELNCPQCGKPLRYRASPEFGGKYANILAALIEARRERQNLTITELCEAAYVEFEHDPTRMPGDPIPIILAFMSRHKNKLASMGWTILTPRETNDHGYCLVPVDME